MGAIIVQKYGGSSVASAEKLRTVAELVVAKKKRGYDLVVVVSAMGDTTDHLLAMARELSSAPHPRELDMLLSVGERVAMSLLAIAIRELGFEAVSLTGSQSGIITTASHTNARIMEVRPFRIQDELERGRIAIVAGYQGVSYKREVTTLGRGGSDTTAVALAAALSAEACEIYSDVAGVYNADPRIVPEAQKLPAIGFEEMQELAESGAKVLNAQAVEFAKRKGIAIYARKTGSSDAGTVVRKDVPTSPYRLRGVAHESQLYSLTSEGEAEAQVLGFLADLDQLGVFPKQIISSSGPTGLSFSCLISLDDLHQTSALKASQRARLPRARAREDLGAISLIGEGILREAKTLHRAHDALSAAGIAVGGMFTSSFRITFLVPCSAVADGVRRLHQEFRLNEAQMDAIPE